MDADVNKIAQNAINSNAKRIKKLYLNQDISI